MPVRKDTKKLIINMEYNKEDEYYRGEIKSQIQSNTVKPGAIRHPIKYENM